MVMFIYREEYVQAQPRRTKGVAEIIIAKQRNGPTGTVKLAFISEYTRFENIRTGKDNKGRRICIPKRGAEPAAPGLLR